MGYAIMRLQKIKAASSFAAIERHDRQRGRLKHRKNAAREHENRQLQNRHYSSDQTLPDRFAARTEGLKYRKDAVLAYEIVCAYSPEAAPFIPEKEWIKANLQWVSATFGGAKNVIGAYYHCDESTPHLHFVVVPVYNGKLNAKHYTGGKVLLSKLQDSYADAMAPFDLARGRRYADAPEIASAHHKTLNEYYAASEHEKLSEREKMALIVNDIFDGSGEVKI